MDFNDWRWTKVANQVDLCFDDYRLVYEAYANEFDGHDMSESEAWSDESMDGDEEEEMCLSDLEDEGSGGMMEDDKEEFENGASAAETPD